MTNYFIRKCIKNAENVKDPAVRRAYGRLAGIGGLITNGVLAAAKVLLGLLFGSVAIMADGVNNLTDASSSLITLVSFRLASRPADDDHPYGYARIEYIAGLMVSFLVIFLAFELAVSSVKKILHPEPTETSTLAMLVLVLAILAKLWLSGFYKKIGTAIQSTTVLASAEDSRNDVVSTAAVLCGVAIERFFGLQVDGYIGVLVALFIVWSGIGLIKETSAPLLGEVPDPELVQELHDRVLRYEGVYGIHDLIVHNYGPGRTFASVHVEVPAERDVMESHDLMDNIERDIHAEMNIFLVCHMDPINRTDPFLAEAETHVRRIAKEIPGVISVHDIRVVTGPTHNNIVFDVVVPQTFEMSESDLASLFERKMKEVSPSYYTVITVDRSYV